MPNPPYLYAKDLSKTLLDMHKNKRYGKLVFYLEACESGSMFYNGLLPNNISVCQPQNTCGMHFKNIIHE